MQPHPRYDIIAQIATGDFATVFRARDKELARDVAIKQIHPQFLSDPRQLNRYWDEAQILASLEHPNVLTIYDIDRQRGWLILELMTDTMQSRAGGKPLDLELIRMGLVCGLKSLEFLHKRNIIHGDVKPSNLLIDSRNWIKLCDFGLAQRAADDQGSLFKGTTRYIAPERVDPEIFGPVGPQSDLYSLGFSMYELLCGNAFESLFPGLQAFGADKQIAWMMWHAGPDRKMPDINRVLKGVPEDLAHVIERLVAKDPKNRYRDAQEAIRDLKIGMGKGGVGLTEAEKAEAEAAAAEEAKKKRRKNLLIAAVVSMVASMLVLLLIPSPEPPKTVKPLQAVDGRLVQIYASDASDDPNGKSPQNQRKFIGKFVVDTPVDKAHKIVMIRPFDQVYLNDVLVDIHSDEFELSFFEKQDHVQTDIDDDKSTDRQIQIIHVTRPIQETGIITDIQPEKNAFVFAADRMGKNTKGFLVRLPEVVSIEVNEKQLDTTQSEAIKLLEPQDFATIRHNAFINENNRQEGRIVAPKTTIRVIRKLVTSGTIQNVDIAQRSIDVKTKKGSIIQLPLKKEGKVFLNGRNLIGDRRLTLADLKYGDSVTVRHDTDAVRIDAERTSKAKGTVTKVIAGARKVTISLEDKDRPSLTFSLPNSVRPTLNGNLIKLK
ncbi:MAG: serine/threonine protein kinase [Planctomycetales bacterium]